MKRLLLFTCVWTALCSAAATSALTAPAKPQTRIETDQAAGTIRFIVGGREEARIDKAGLHVRGSIEYGGSEADIGEAAYGR
jgi:hypothetical protein